MKDFILGLRIRIKLLAAFGSILLLSILLIIFSVKSIDQIIYYKSINEEVDLLKLRLETLDLATKEFMYEGYKSKSFLEDQQSASIDAFQENYILAKTSISKIEESQSDNQNDSGSLALTTDSLQNDFLMLVELLKRRGFKDFGLEGSLRSAIHKVENSGFEFDKVTMLMLRRHEKDFFLRKDLKYQVEFNNRFDTFRQSLEPTAGIEILSFLDNYKSEFNNVVTIEKEIGLNENEGIRGRIKKYFTVIRPNIERVLSSTKEENAKQISDTKLVVWIIFIMQITTGIGMALVYSKLLTKSIKEIRDGIQQLASGVFPEKLQVLTTEEIGQTKIAFNQFIDRLKTASTFAQGLGNGTQTMYDHHYANDVLAKSLISAQEKLHQAEEQQKKVNWMNEGSARFSDILKNDSDELNIMGDNVLKLLVNYLHANQGALYILKGSDEDKYLERISTYAYGKKKFIDERIGVGTGLVGQCVLEGETIYLKEIPIDFVKITSGLGEATPKNVVIVPLKIKDNVMGVIELASFETMEAYQIEFVEKIAENIATLLSNKQTSLETKRLLEESRQRSHSLAQQEEELRQNSEELQATHEEMERQRSAMLEEIANLKEKLALQDSVSV